MKFIRNLYKCVVPVCCLWLGIVASAQAQYVDDERVDSVTNSVRRPRKRFNPENMIVGTHFAVGFSNGLSGSLAPYAGYRVFDMLAFGAGVSYLFNMNSYYNTLRTSSVYGASAFLRVRPFAEGYFRSLYLHGELEVLHAELANPSYNPSLPNSGIPQTIARTGPRANVGLGYATNFADGWGFTIEYLYNVLHYQNSLPIYASPFIYRVGAYYGF